MQIQVTDWGDFKSVLPLALEHQVGMEVSEFTDPDALDHIKAIIEPILQKAHLLPSLGVHGPFSELVPASRDPLVQQLARTRFQQGCEITNLLHAGHLVLHSGFIPKTYQRDQWIQASSQFWVDFLSEKPTTSLVHVENVYEDDFSTLEELVDRVNEQLQADILSICLDIGHVNANSTRTLEDWIRNLGDRIRYVHLHNNGGTLDDHWRLDQGTINMRTVLSLLQEHSPHSIWTIETIRADIEPSLAWMHTQGYL